MILSRVWEPRHELPDQERLLIEALREFQAEFPISPDRTRVRTAVRKLEFDLLRYLRDEADSGSMFAPDEVELSVGDEDYGRVIGKGGRVANAIRTIAKAAAVRIDRRVIVDILD